MGERLAQSPIRPHGEEARARDAIAVLLILRARAVSNHEGGARMSSSSFEVHRTVGKSRLCDAPQDEEDTSSHCARPPKPQSPSLWPKQPTRLH
jgi:hypothetical protein